MPVFTGKTRLLQAIEWWTLQLGWSDNVVKTAYTWRASKQLDTPLSNGHSTCHTFGIKPYGAGGSSVPTSGIAANRRAQHIRGSTRRLLVVDESSFLSGPHFHDMHTAATLSRAAAADTTDLFGGHLILCGDPCQHEPVTGTALYAATGGASSSSTQGQQLYRAIPAVFMLTTQHRRSADPEADRLARYAGYFDGLLQPTLQQVQVGSNRAHGAKPRGCKKCTPRTVCP